MNVNRLSPKLPLSVSTSSIHTPQEKKRNISDRKISTNRLTPGTIYIDDRKIHETIKEFEIRTLRHLNKFSEHYLLKDPKRVVKNTTKHEKNIINTIILINTTRLPLNWFFVLGFNKKDLENHAHLLEYINIKDIFLKKCPSNYVEDLIQNAAQNVRSLILPENRKFSALPDTKAFKHLRYLKCHPKQIIGDVPFEDHILGKAYRINTERLPLKNFQFSKDELMNNAHLFEYMDLRGCFNPKDWTPAEIYDLIENAAPNLKCLMLGEDATILSLPGNLNQLATLKCVNMKGLGLIPAYPMLTNLYCLACPNVTFEKTGYTQLKEVEILPVSLLSSLPPCPKLKIINSNSNSEIVERKTEKVALKIEEKGSLQLKKEEGEQYLLSLAALINYSQNPVVNFEMQKNTIKELAPYLMHMDLRNLKHEWTEEEIKNLVFNRKKKLVTLALDEKSDLTKLPSEKLRHLETFIGLNLNKLTDIPDDLKLKRLILYNCKSLTQLPKISELQALFCIKNKKLEKPFPKYKELKHTVNDVNIIQV